MQPLNFEAEISKIFGELVSRYNQDPDKQQLSFVVEAAYGSRTFDQLDQLSKLLGTRDINLNTAFVADSGCGSCGHGYSVVIPISCRGIVFYPCKFNEWIDYHGLKQCGLQATNKTHRFCGKHAALRCLCGRQAQQSCYSATADLKDISVSPHSSTGIINVCQTCATDTMRYEELRVQHPRRE